MKSLFLLAAMAGGLAVFGMTDTANADHCRSGRSFGRRGGISSFSYYTVPRARYSPVRVYPRTFGYGGGFGYRPYRSSGFNYYRPGFSISIGSGYRGFVGNRGFGYRHW